MPLHPRGDLHGDVTAASFGGDLRLGDITPGTPKEVRWDRTRAALAGEGREFSLSMPVKRASRGTALAWVTGAGIVCTLQEKGESGRQRGKGISRTGPNLLAKNAGKWGGGGGGQEQQGSLGHLKPQGSLSTLHWAGLLLSRGGGGGEGVLDPKLGVPKMA